MNKIDYSCFCFGNIKIYAHADAKQYILNGLRDEIKSSGKISIINQFKIAGGGGPSEGENLR